MTNSIDNYISWEQFAAHLEAHVQKYTEEVIEKNLQEIGFKQ